MGAHMLSKLAELLVSYCIKATKGDEVRVSATYDAMSLVKELWKSLVSLGAYPYLSLVDEELEEIFYLYASEELLKHVPRVDKFIYENINAFISIISSTHTKHLISVAPEKLSIRAKTLGELSNIFINRESSGDLRWVATIYPTKALAQEAGMSLIAYKDFIFSALKLYEPNPIDAWIRQAEKQSRIVNVLSKVSELRFVGEGIDLHLRVDGRTWINDDGRKNMPGGEVYTAPIEDSVEGYVVFTYPAIWRGIEIDGVKLFFRGGKVINASATKGEEFIKKIINIDEGSRRVGEVAFGLNYNINRFTKQILLDEKMGGTIHLALGSAYLGSGGTNKSAIHLDLIKDMSKGKVIADGDVIYSDGRFLSDVL